MPPEPATLADAHWKALRAKERAEAGALLSTLRTLGGSGADVNACRALAHALSRAHWDAGRWGESDQAHALLDELRALCRRPDADEAQRFELSKALGTAHWDAVRYSDGAKAGRLLGELRSLARRKQATEGQRLVLAEALANEIRLQGGPRGDAERIPPLLSDLRRLADRTHAPEEQRDALARALLDLHHVARTEPAGEQRVQELRALAERAVATPLQRLALVEALHDVPWKAGLFGSRVRQDALLTAVRGAESAATEGQRSRELLCDTLVRMHAKVRRARDDAFADRILDRIRTVVVHPDADVGTWVALATAVCDGLWIAGAFANRELAEELVEILALLTGDVTASTRQRVTLAGLLVGAHHRAVRHEDALLSKELLNLLYAWAIRPGAAAEVREVLAHGLELADTHARQRGDKALARKIEAALAEIGPSPETRIASQLSELALDA